MKDPNWASDSNKQFAELQGEFTILRGFSGMEKALQFSVTDPQKAKSSDHIVYTVKG